MSSPGPGTADGPPHPGTHPNTSARPEPSHPGPNSAPQEKDGQEGDGGQDVPRHVSEQLPSATASDLHDKLMDKKGKLTDKKEHLKNKKTPPGGFDPTPLPDAPQGYTVKFTFHRAYNLPAGDLRLKSSDPFILATLIAAVPKRHKEDPPLVHRTRTLHKTTEPAWEEDWTVANVPASGFMLKCRLYDEDWPDHDDRLGSVTILADHVGVNWEGLGRHGREFELKKRSGSKRAYLVRGAAVSLCGKGSITPRLHVSIKVLGKSDPPHAHMYTVGPTTWVKHYSPMIGRLTGTKVNKDQGGGAGEGAQEPDRQTKKYDFQATAIQLAGPVPPRLYHRFVEFRPMIGRMFSRKGVRGTILHKVLHKQHSRIYNYNSGTEYGSFAPCSEEASLQLLRLAHFDEGGRMFAYVITLDGLMRFTETGKEFGIDLLSKHTMHADVATYVACAGEFFIRRLSHPVDEDQGEGEDEGQGKSEDEGQGKSEDEGHGQNGERDHAHDDNDDENDNESNNQNDNNTSQTPPHRSPSPSSSTSSTPHPDPNPPQPTHPPSSPPGGPPTSPPPPQPNLYQLIIDNDSGTYRPDKSILPDLQSFLSRNFPGLQVIAMHCADETLSDMKKAQAEAKEREGAGVRMVLNRSPSLSSSSGSFSSDDESRLGALDAIDGNGGEEGGGGGGGNGGAGLRSKKERVFDAVWGGLSRAGVKGWREGFGGRKKG